MAATKAAREAGAVTLAMVNVADSPVAAAAEFVVPILAGPERAVAATKSVVNSMLAGALLVATLSEDQALRVALAAVPDRLARASALDWLARRLGAASDA